MANRQIIRNLRYRQRKNERLLTVELRKWFSSITKQIRKDISGRFKKDAADFTDWSSIEKKGNEFLQPVVLKIYLDGEKAAARALGITTTFEVYDINALGAVERICSELVTQVTEGTRAAISMHIASGIEEGKSMYTVGRELRNVVGLNVPQMRAVQNYRIAQIEKYPGISAKKLNNKIVRYSKKKLKLRTETIARTETARAQSEGYRVGARDAGINELELSASSTACDRCQELDGKKFSTEEAEGILPVHPNCLCLFLPVV